MTVPYPPIPPHSQPAKRRAWPWLLAIVVALIAGIGIGAAIPADEVRPADGQDVAAPATSEAPEPATTPDPPETEPPAPATTQTESTAFALGETGTYSEDGAEVGEMTVESVETSAEAPDEYSEPPANGVYLTVTVAATALDGQLYDVNPFDFYVRDGAGNRWDQMSGNAFYAATDTDLSAVTLNGGETVRGTISFDVPAEVTEIVYAPGLRALGVWELGL